MYSTLKLYNDSMSDPNEPFAGLQKMLDHLVEQALAYERALPVDNYAARAAVAVLARLAAQARNEAVSLVFPRRYVAPSLPLDPCLACCLVHFSLYSSSFPF